MTREGLLSARMCQFHFVGHAANDRGELYDCFYAAGHRRLLDDTGEGLKKDDGLGGVLGDNDRFRIR